jgi:hypothetical protein
MSTRSVMQDRAPDVVGEVLAYRAWYVDLRWDREARLVSFNGTVWPRAAWLAAECSHDGCDTPGERCSCGVYAARDRAHLLHMGFSRRTYNESPIVIGEVGLVGKVIPGSQGWRAQKARPVRLELPHQHWRLMPSLRATYRVPVALSNTLREA